MNTELCKIEEKAQRAIEAYAMLPENELVVVGLSGGADSVALTHFLWRLQAVRRFTLQAAHLNHGLRGAAADRDEQFARSFCASRGIPLHVRQVCIADLARAGGCGTEACGRAARYAFFDELTAGGGRIATAHTASDNAETMLMNFARGAGTHGLRGIPPVRGKIVRPFIALSRNEIEHYCAYYHLEYVTDETNLERDYVRNQIRLDAVPVFRKINPAFEAAATRAAEQLAQDDAFLTRQMEDAVRTMRQGGGWRLDAVRTLPDPLLSRFLAAETGRAGAGRLTSLHLRLAMQAVRNGGGVSVPGGIQVNAAGNTLFIERHPAQEWAPVPLQRPVTTLPDGRVFRMTEVSEAEIENLRKFNNLLFNNLLSYDTITDNMFLRTRQPGDCFSPRARGVTKSLKKLFNEAKFSPLQRARELLLADAAGNIVWMEHFGPGGGAGWSADKKGPYVRVGIDDA